MEAGSQDRNLPASERKLQKAREDGQVSRSEDLSHLAVLGAGALAIVTLSPQLMEHLREDMGRQLTFDAATLKSAATAFTRLSDAVAVGLTGCAVLAAIIISAALVSAIASGGWVLSLKPLMPDVSRLNPLSGFANLFSKKKLMPAMTPPKT